MEPELIENECGCKFYFDGDEVVDSEVCDSHYSDCCMDCERSQREYDEYYMVKNEIWAEAVFQSEWYRLLCIGCLESRLSRKLQPEDFMQAPINSFEQSQQHSWRQQWRLGYLGV